MRRWESVRVPGASGSPWGGTAIDVARGGVLAHSDHAATGINSITEAAGHLGRESPAIQVNMGALAEPTLCVGGVVGG